MTLPEAPTLLDNLRAATRSRHDALHGHPLLAPLAGPGVTRAQYHSALQAFEAFYRAMESGRTVDVPAGLPDAPVRDWLRRDLKTAGVQPLELDFAVPAVDSEARLVGYLYVKQGSTLGGAVMSKNLSRTLGLRPGRDQFFFNGYGAETGPRWKEFIENLFRRAPLLPQSEIIEMAVSSFQAIADVCDAVHIAKASHAVQTPPATVRSPAQAGA